MRFSVKKRKASGAMVSDPIQRTMVAIGWCVSHFEYPLGRLIGGGLSRRVFLGFMVLGALAREKLACQTQPSSLAAKAPDGSVYHFLTKGMNLAYPAAIDDNPFVTILDFFQISRHCAG
jgi:hypothetical protein